MGTKLIQIKNLYDQRNFSPEERLAITKAVIELADPLKNSNLDESRLRRNNNFEDNAVVFYKNDLHDVRSHFRCIKLHS